MPTRAPTRALTPPSSSSLLLPPPVRGVRVVLRHASGGRGGKPEEKSWQEIAAEAADVAK